MAERYSFFNATINEVGGYDREYLAEDFARYFSSFIGNGVYANPSNSLQVTARDNMVVEVAKGKAWINGYFYENTTAKSLSLDLADGTTERIDRIVVRLDLISRKITTEIKKGLSSINAEPPVLQRDSNIYELALADIKINKNIISISQADITDNRFNKNLCGIVSGVVDQIDATELFNQYNEIFINWFDNIRNQLDGDVAGNLQNQINTINSKLKSHNHDDRYYTKAGVKEFHDNSLKSQHLKFNANSQAFKVLSEASYTSGNIVNINYYIEAQTDVMNNTSELFMGTLSKKPLTDTIITILDDGTKSLLTGKILTSGALSVRGNNLKGKRYLIINATYCC